MFTVPKISLFQFHKGTIKTVTSYMELPVLPHFNSIKVQLRLYTDSDFTYLKEFQFHKGTIKT